MDEPDLDTLREQILASALVHVPFDGWTMAAIRRGAADAGYGLAAVERAFPGGPAEVVALHSQVADRRMLEALEEQDLNALPVRERIAAAVRKRLEQNAGDREAIRRALAFLALPQNAALGAKALYRTVDAIWHAAGDTATDHNFYTKRGLLAGVYSATLLYWLNDGSDGFADSWAFLDRRIADVMRFPKALGRITRSLNRLPNPLRLLQPRRRRFRGVAP